MLAGAARAVRRRLPRLRRFEIVSSKPSSSSGAALAAIGLDLVAVTEDNLPLALEFRPAGVVSQLARHLRGGCRGWYACERGRVAAYGFLATPDGAPMRVRRVFVHPGEAAAVLFFTRPEWRGRGVATALLSALKARAAKVPGVETVIAWSPRANRAARRVQLKAGFAPAGTLWVFEFLGRPVARLTFGSPVKR